MSKILSHIKYLARLSILGTLLLLGGCGDTGSFQLADGIGGTGITMGRLTGFGSVYVNGVHFNTDNAQFIRDGKTSSVQSDFNIGEIIRVVGTVNDDKKTGIASKVIYSDILEGPVTRVADGREIRVMEQHVVTDQLTVFHGFKKLADLRQENIVEVSGYTNAEGNIQATSIKLISDAFLMGDMLELDGVVSELNVAGQTFKINDLTVQYSQAMLIDFIHAELRNGLYLTVTAQQAVNDGVITAYELAKIDDAPEAGIGYEIEGLVSYFLSSGYFEIDGYPFSSNADTEFYNGSAADLDEDSFMIVSGTANNQGIIIAESITLLDYDSEVYVDAAIEAIDLTNNTLTVLGQTVSINTHTLLSDDTTEEFVVLELNQFSVGEAVYIVAYKDASGDYIASRLSRTTPVETLYLSGDGENPDALQGSLTLFDNRITSYNETLYLDIDLNTLNRAEFFAQLETEGVYVEITGPLISEGNILAETMILVD